MRLSKTVNGVKTTHIWDGSNIVMELNASNAVIDIYIRGVNLIKNNSGYYIFNAHGDVVSLANASGTVTKNYHYDAFGNETNKDTNDKNPFRYCGEYLDLSSGTYYLRARYYNPSNARFLTEDTHWNVNNMIYGDDPLQLNEYTYVPNIYATMQSGNLYAYCVNNPLRFIDPYGYRAGDIFESMNAAAIDWAIVYYGVTDYLRMELSSLIYIIFDGDTFIGYSYTTAIIGSPHEATGIWDGFSRIPENGKVKAYIHSHPNSTKFSQDDKRAAEALSIDAYMVARGNDNGSVNVKKYVPTPKHSPTIKTLYGEFNVGTDEQFNKISHKQSQILFSYYRRVWRNHIEGANGCKFCKHVSWPNR